MEYDVRATLEQNAGPNKKGPFDCCEKLHN
ncbi:hypothetical protein RCCS2_07099 [Roseobacter sp. CCS2]|nr:hypothetical protein RCCS2_07099 [Roseobacter sp. CCS2]